MMIKKGDKVIVRIGREKGKTATVVKVFPKEAKVVLEGLNKMKKHQRRGRGEKGQMIERTMPMSVSNVMLIDPKDGKGTRVSSKVVGKTKVRIAVRSKQEVK